MIRHVLRLACVPEQVNLPIQIALERNIFQKYHIDVDVKWVPEGTGKMIDMIEKNEVDVALTVSDALLVAIAKGRKVHLSGVFVPSPLVWAICTSPENTHLKSLQDLFNAKRSVHPDAGLDVGISRLGSGSQTMAYYMADLHKINTSLNFTIANNIDGLRNGVQQKQFDLFLWETFTTKPLFDTNQLHKIGEVPTPWSAFSIATQHLSRHHEDHFTKYNLIKQSLYPALYESIEIFLSNKEEAIDRIVASHHHKREDAETWLNNVRYAASAGFPVDCTNVDDSLQVLKRVGLVSADFNNEEIWKGDSCVSLITNK